LKTFAFGPIKITAFPSTSLKEVDKFCMASFAEFYPNQAVNVKSMDRALLVPPFTVLTYYTDFHEIQNFSLKFGRHFLHRI
jgi:hypothetical protein